MLCEVSVCGECGVCVCVCVVVYHIMSERGSIVTKYYLLDHIGSCGFKSGCYSLSKLILVQLQLQCHRSTPVYGAFFFSCLPFHPVEILLVALY